VEKTNPFELLKRSFFYMAVFILLLRGINVSGHRKVPMKALKGLLENAGFESVLTYIQSGNVVFKSDLSVEMLQEKAEKLIAAHFGFDVKCLVLTAERFVNIFRNHPYYQESCTVEKLYFTLLWEHPKQEQWKLLQETVAPGEHFTLTNKTLYFCYENGYGTAKISNPFVEQKLKVFATTRNWKTMKALTGLLNN